MDIYILDTYYLYPCRLSAAPTTRPPRNRSRRPSGVRGDSASGRTGGHRRHTSPPGPLAAPRVRIDAVDVLVLPAFRARQNVIGCDVLDPFEPAVLSRPHRAGYWTVTGSTVSDAGPASRRKPFYRLPAKVRTCPSRGPSTINASGASIPPAARAGRSPLIQQATDDRGRAQQTEGQQVDGLHDLQQAPAQPG